MESSRKKTSGSMRVSEDVILKIAETAACETEGVAVSGSRLEPPTAISKLRGTVRARVIGESAAIRLDISVLDGCNAVDVAEKIQRSVKSAVQNMTGFTVTRVDVNIADIKINDVADSAE